LFKKISISLLHGQNGDIEESHSGEGHVIATTGGSKVRGSERGKRFSREKGGEKGPRAIQHSGEICS